jgi:hypothetical protein
LVVWKFVGGLADARSHLACATDETQGAASAVARATDFNQLGKCMGISWGFLGVEEAQPSAVDPGWIELNTS